MKPAGTQTCIEFAIDQVDTLVPKDEVCDDGTGQAVGEAECDELDCLG
jgi:hypothetical protein